FFIAQTRFNFWRFNTGCRHSLNTERNIIALNGDFSERRPLHIQSWQSRRAVPVCLVRQIDNQDQLLARDLNLSAPPSLQGRRSLWESSRRADELKCKAH